MIIIGSVVVGVLIFFTIVLVTILLGASARGQEKEAEMRTEAERRAGLTGGVNTDTPDPIHDRYLDRDAHA